MPTQASQAKKTGPRSRRFRLLIAFDGTAYEGWQIQKIGTGVQEKVEAALARLFPAKPRVHSSSRTDTGVHALGMVAHFDVPSEQCPMHARKLALAINAWLPEDIRVMKAVRVSTAFHARFSARGKQYRYFIWNHPAMNPLMRSSAWHVPKALDLGAMKKAAGLFVGTHDFASFTANPGYQRKSTIRRITRCGLTKRGPLVTIVIEGDGFLYKMCRGMAGTLAQVGLGKLVPADIPPILDKKNRSIAGMTAPAHGLTLWKVFYGKTGAHRKERNPK